VKSAGDSAGQYAVDGHKSRRYFDISAHESPPVIPTLITASRPRPAVAVECPHGGGVTTHNDKTAKCSFAGAACTNALPVERQAAGASSSLLPTGSGLLTSTLG